MTSIAQRFYLVGYSGHVLSRPIRRVLAATQWHRAWLQGYTGMMDGQFGKLTAIERNWYSYRKGQYVTRTLGLLGLLAHLRDPFAFTKESGSRTIVNC